VSYICKLFVFLFEFEFVKCDITVFNWHDNGIILKPQFHFMFIYQSVLNIRDTNMAAEKYSRLYRPINLFIFIIYNVV
jgi:hypothetical protein